MKKYSWKDYPGMGNRFRRGLEPMMLTEGGAIIPIVRKLERGKYGATETVNVVYDREFVKEKLTREVIKPLAITEEKLIELIKECYSDIKAKQLQLWGNSESTENNS